MPDLGLNSRKITTVKRPFGLLSIGVVKACVFGALLTAIPALRVKSPIIEECVLHYECKLVHGNEVVPKALADEIRRANYGAGDYHTFFFGEVVAVRADKNLRRRL